MDWLPHTVESFAKLGWQQMVGLCFFALVSGLLFLLWRHLGQVIVLFTEYVALKRENTALQFDANLELKKQSIALANIDKNQTAAASSLNSLDGKVTANNKMTAQMLAKMGDDGKPICNAPPTPGQPPAKPAPA